MSRLSLSPVAVAFALGLASTGHAEDWATWRGPNGNGTTKETVSIVSAPKQLWKLNLGVSYASVTVKAGRVYAIGADATTETVQCIDVNTGKPIWKHTYNHAKREAQADPNPLASNATPVVDGNRVFTISREGLVHCLDAANGRVQWQKDLAKDFGALIPTWGFSGTPHIDGNILLFNAGPAGIALDKRTGALIWKSAGEQTASFSSPVPYTLGGKRYATFSNNEGYLGIEVATGSVAWRHPWKAFYNVNAADAVVDGTDIFLTDYQRGQRVHLVTGKATPEIIYETQKMGSYSTTVRVGQHLYGAGKGFLKCMDWKTGSIAWETRGLGSGTVIVAGSDLIALTEGGELLVVAIDPTKYVEKARYKVMDGPCYAQPVLANGKIFCRNNAGDLICLQTLTAK